MLTFLALVVLEFLHGEEGGTSSEDLMAERRLVWVLALVVVLLSVVCRGGQRWVVTAS